MSYEEAYVERIIKAAKVFYSLDIGLFSLVLIGELYMIVRFLIMQRKWRIMHLTVFYFLGTVTILCKIIFCSQAVKYSNDQKTTPGVWLSTILLSYYTRAMINLFQAAQMVELAI